MVDIKGLDHFMVGGSIVGDGTMGSRRFSRGRGFSGPMCLVPSDRDRRKAARQCKDVTPCVSNASITPSKIRPTPIAETKNPTMRVAASIPRGPIFRVSFSA